MSALTTLRGTLTDDYFILSTGEKVRYAPVKNFNYNKGEVFALFEICANSYILWQTIPVNPSDH